MSRSNVGRLQQFLKKTREYKSSVVFSNNIFFNSEVGEKKRDDLIKRYEELKPLIEQAIGGPPLRYVLGQHLKIFDWAYSDRDLKTARECIRLAPEFIVRTIAYLKGERRKSANDEATTPVYIQPNIIQLFKDRQKQKKDNFDYTKLIGLLEEVNFNYNAQKPYSTAALIRAVLDHIPPLLGFSDFKLLANHYQGGETIGKHIKKLLVWRDTPDDVLHTPIGEVSTSIIMDYLPPQIQLDRLLKECVKTKGNVVQLMSVRKTSDKIKLKVKIISEMSWANYAIRHGVWSSFRAVIEIDNYDSSKPDFISATLTGKENGQEWIGKNYYFENADSPNIPFKIEAYDLKRVGLFVSNIDFGNSQRFQMPELKQGSVFLTIQSRSSTQIKIPIQSINRG